MVTINSCVSLRNALITSLLIRSVRRAQEFTEMTVAEWKSRTQHKGETSIIKVKIHKTMSYGKAELVLNKLEEKALKAYMLYRRKLFTCRISDACPVFLSSVPSTRAGAVQGVRIMNLSDDIWVLILYDSLSLTKTSFPHQVPL